MESVLALADFHLTCCTEDPRIEEPSDQETEEPEVWGLQLHLVDAA